MQLFKRGTGEPLEAFTLAGRILYPAHHRHEGVTLVAVLADDDLVEALLARGWRHTPREALGPFHAGNRAFGRVVEPAEHVEAVLAAAEEVVEAAEEVVAVVATLPPWLTRPAAPGEGTLGPAGAEREQVAEAVAAAPEPEDVGDDPTWDEPTEDAPPAEQPDLTVLAGPVREVLAHADTLWLPASVEALLAAEREGAARKSAIRGLERRLGFLLA